MRVGARVALLGETRHLLPKTEMANLLPSALCLLLYKLSEWSTIENHEFRTFKKRDRSTTIAFQHYIIFYLNDRCQLSQLEFDIGVNCQICLSHHIDEDKFWYGRRIFSKISYTNSKNPGQGFARLRPTHRKRSISTSLRIRRFLLTRS